MTDIKFPNAFETQNEGGTFPAVFLCEHARNYIPPALHGLGVPHHDIDSHIGWDIGIEAVTRRLSDVLDVPSVYCLYSRLIIDCNRPLDHPQLIRPESDEIPIPGNVGLSEAEQKERIDQIFHAYHNAAEGLIEKVSARTKPFIIGMHSCTDQLRGHEYRPWEIGLSTHGAEDFMHTVAAELRKEGMNVGIHQPFDCRDMKDSLYTHGERRGLDHILVEIRNDLIHDEAGQSRWVEIMARVYKTCVQK